MIEIALMVEGQDGLNWRRWQNIARVTEESGYVGLYRSDHFTNPSGPYKDSLECWISLAWLATHSSRLEFGPLVSPTSFRHPSMLVRMAAAVADLSGGRLQFGLGAGWQEREHTNYGYHLGGVPERMARFREAIQITAHLLHSDKPLTFEGKHYRLRDAVLLPRPSHKIPIVIGGAGRGVTLPLVAHYADEWNVGLRTPQQFRELNDYLNLLLDRVGRPHASVRRSMMIFVRDLRLHEVQELVAGLETVGLQRMMLNWPNFDDLEGIATFGKALVTSRV